jgi:hypothetical protein
MLAAAWPSGTRGRIATTATMTAISAATPETNPEGLLRDIHSTLRRVSDESASGLTAEETNRAHCNQDANWSEIFWRYRKSRKRNELVVLPRAELAASRLQELWPN